MEKQPWATDRWYISRYNFCEEVTSQRNPPKEVIISDCTLRDGEQQPGVTLRKDEKLRLACAMDEMGIHEIEAGWPAVSQNERDALKAIANAGLKANIRAVCRAVKNDIDLAIDCGMRMISLSLPIGDLQVDFKLEWSEEKMIATAVELTNYAHQQGLYVVLSPYDTTRANPVFLEKYLSNVVGHGHVDRVRLVDTVGSATPLAMKYLVKKIAEVTHRPIEVHCHNDFGLAVANTLAAIEAGASVASTGLNGIGPRAGNAATEEVALALHVIYGIDLGLKYEKFYELCQLSQELTNVPVQRNKAVVGPDTFSEEAGMVVAGWLKNPFTAQGYLPDLVGQHFKVVIGKGSGRDSMRWKLDQLGLEATDEQLVEITSQAKEESERTKSTLSDEAIRRISDRVKYT